MFTLIPMKKNKLFNFFLLGLISFSLFACAKVPDEKPLENNTAQESDNDPVQESDETHYKLLDKEYILPSSYQILKEDGWELEDNPEFLLEAGKIIRNRYVRKGPYILELTFFNPSDQEQRLEDSLVAGVAAENRTFGTDQASDIKVGNRINFETSLEEIENQMGDYNYEESAQFKTYIFEHNPLSKTEIKVDVDTNTIRWIIIENYNLD